MKEFRFSNSVLDEQTFELQKFFEYLKASDNIFPALIGEKVVLVKVKFDKNEQGDVVSSTIVSTASADNNGNFNGVPIPFKFDYEYNDIINQAMSDESFDKGSIDSESKRDVYVEYVKLQNRINEIKAKGINVKLLDGKVVLSKDFEVVGETEKEHTERTLELK